MSHLTDAEVKATILSFLEKKGCWGAHYFPFDAIVKWLGRKVKRNGKRVRDCIEELAKEGYILFHKKGETISLNPARSRDIIEYIKSVLKS
ncbi:MAG: hypothetical protein AOA65_1492 [Candidatus Bathyarchaeota archaeon BA1]|nr:MAG: hypothetical protein AOA65_1492 [Candidatus Bathyarchaeota archaeon BA1]